MSPDWMSLELSRLASSPATLRLDRLARALLLDFQTFCHDQPKLRRMLDSFEHADLALLADLKEALQRGVRVFELHQRRTRVCGARALRDAAIELVAVFERASERLDAELDIPQELLPTLEDGVPMRPPALAPTRRLYTSSHWILDRDASKNLIVLQRTPAAWSSLAELRAENSAILSGLRDEHRADGLLVDMRYAPIRNDTEFENAMAALREGLTAHFKRTAVLLETRLGELQVTRLERDERRSTLATRSESAALKFLSGGK